MLDINYIKENPNEVVDRLAAKGKDASEDVAKILELDAKRRALIGETEGYKWMTEDEFIAFVNSDKMIESQKRRYREYFVEKGYVK